MKRRVLFHRYYAGEAGRFNPGETQELDGPLAQDVIERDFAVAMPVLTEVPAITVTSQDPPAEAPTSPDAGGRAEVTAPGGVESDEAPPQAPDDRPGRPVVTPSPPHEPAPRGRQRARR
jgi:hypothetical protein